MGRSKQGNAERTSRRAFHKGVSSVLDESLKVVRADYKRLRDWRETHSPETTSAEEFSYMEGLFQATSILLAALEAAVTEIRIAMGWQSTTTFAMQTIGAGIKPGINQIIQARYDLVELMRDRETQKLIKTNLNGIPGAKPDVEEVIVGEETPLTQIDCPTCRGRGYRDTMIWDMWDRNFGRIMHTPCPDCFEGKVLIGEDPKQESPKLTVKVETRKPETPTFKVGNGKVCPECQGKGCLRLYHFDAMAEKYFKVPSADRVYCDACKGIGFVADV